MSMKVTVYNLRQEARRIIRELRMDGYGKIRIRTISRMVLVARHGLIDWKFVDGVVKDALRDERVKYDDEYAYLGW